MITAGEFRNGVTFEQDGQVLQVVEFQHVKPGKGAAFVRTKTKNVITGSVTETSYNPTAKFPQAFIERRSVTYNYVDGDLYYFMDGETYDMIPVAAGDLPDNFKFCKENDECKLMSYKGNYPYPTTYTDEIGTPQNEKTEIVRTNSHVHFNHMIGDEEMIIISRPQRGAMVYFTSFSYLFLGLCALLYVFANNDKKKKGFKSNYFRTRINAILFTTSFMILTSMTTISVLFVYKRNQVNMQNLMSTKITTIQALIGNRIRQTESWQDLRGQEFAAALENIGNTTKSDITLYTPEGKVFLSTTPEVFEKMIIGSRIDQEAFHNISHRNQRFFIQGKRSTTIATGRCTHRYSMTTET